MTHSRKERPHEDGCSASRCLTRLWQLTSVELLVSLWPVALQIARLIRGFRRSSLSPQTAFDFEEQLQRLLQEMGRRIVQWTFNALESDDRQDMPSVLLHNGGAYRRKRRSPTRNLNCLFGKIRFR